MLRFLIFLLLAITIFSTVYNYAGPAYGQGTQTSGGVDVDGEWYLGEGLKVGNYFEYKLCELDLNDCSPFTMKFWVAGEKQLGSETLWDVKVVVYDGNKIVKGDMGLGKTAPEPITQSDSLFAYSRAFKSSIAWLSAFATADKADFIHGPKEFRDNAWGKIGAIGGSQLIPKRAETITVAGGTEDTVVVGWYSGNDNEIWVVDDFPFPVKALTYAWVTTGVAPVMFQFNLLKYDPNVKSDPFVNVVPTESEKAKLGCQTEFLNYVSGSKSTNTFSMIIDYAYAPEHPKAGCDLDLKLNFKNKFNQEEFLNEVHYDVWVVDENGNKLRSLADERGKNDLFNGFGLAHLLVPVKEPAGLAHYAVFIYGLAPQNEVPPGNYAGYIQIDINIEENSMLPPVEKPPPTTTEIPTWIKNNAGWWSDDQIGDSDFVSGIQYLINQGIMKIPPTSQGTGTGTDEIPSWIKNNAGWWASGQISDNDFVQGIQYLIQHGIMKIA